MGKPAYCLAIALLLTACFTGCRRDKDPVPPVTEVYETAPPVFKPVIQKINEGIGGFYQALPARYSQTSMRYPLLLFIHGGGQFGNGSYDLPKLLNEGIPQLLDEQKFPPEFIVNGSHYSFIVLAPQFKQIPDHSIITSFIDHAKKTYRIDESRIYICGFSLGARMAFDFSAAFANNFAAIVPISGVPNYEVNEKAKSIALSGLPVWALQNAKDALFNVQDTKDFIAKINSFQPAKPPLLTIFPDSTGLLGHDAWSKATNPQFKENNMNIYEWMLQYKR